MTSEYESHPAFCEAKLCEPKKPVGYWEHRTGFEGPFGVSSIRLEMYRKPNWITRYLMRQLLEIHWIDTTPK